MSESHLITELEEQIYSYVDLCALGGETPTILGYAKHLEESYK